MSAEVTEKALAAAIKLADLENEIALIRYACRDNHALGDLLGAQGAVTAALRLMTAVAARMSRDLEVPGQTQRD